MLRMNLFLISSLRYLCSSYPTLFSLFEYILRLYYSVLYFVLRPLHPPSEWNYREYPYKSTVQPYEAGSILNQRSVAHFMEG